MSDPQFVQLVSARRDGVLTDPKSNWSISGKNVLPFPTDGKQVKFVRRQIALGALESATQQNYDDAHPAFPFPVTIQQGPSEPMVLSDSVSPFWIDTNDPFQPVAKQYVSGEWIVVSGGGGVTLPSGVYVQSTAPSSPSNGNLWIDTSGSPVAKIRNSGSWIILEIPGEESELPVGIFVQNTTPSGSEGDLWINPGADEAYRFISGSWTLLDVPQDGFELPAGLYVQGATPDDPDENDTWVDTDTTPPEVRRYVADTWVELEIPVDEGPSISYLGSATAANANNGSAATVAVPGGILTGDLCVLVTGAQHDRPEVSGFASLATTGRLSFQYKVLDGTETSISTGTSYDWKQMIAAFFRPSVGAVVVVDTDSAGSGIPLDPDTTNAILAVWAGGGGDGSSGVGSGGQAAPSGFADVSLPAGTGGTQTNLRLAVKMAVVPGADLSAYGGGTVDGSGAMSAMTTFKVV